MAWFEVFDLYTDLGFDFNPLSEEIMIVELTGERRTDSIGVVHGAFRRDSLSHQIVAELINYAEIDYDETSELLFKLTAQALSYIQKRHPEPEQFKLVVKQFRKYIAAEIYKQMRANFRVSERAYNTPNVLPFVKIEDWNFTTLPNGRRHYKDVVTPVSLIPKLVFTDFQKAGHLEYKFDSKTEKDFSYILENDQEVLKWLRLANNQFRIYWANNSKLYYPDFVVETAESIYMIQTKAADQMESAEVLDKMKAAKTYCNYASEFTEGHGGKPWKYMLIAHDEVSVTRSFGYFKK